jgi:hypothetical protein
MRHLIFVCAAVALASAGLAGCDDDDRAAPAPARTASTTQCAPAPLPACAPKSGKASATGVSSSSSSSVSAIRSGGVYRSHYRHGGRGGYREDGGYARVEHYGYVDGGSVREDAYATGATMRGGSSVSRTERYSESSRYSESGGFSESGGYSESGSWRSSGHQGRLVIRGRHGEGDSWTWRTAGRDEGGYLVWPGKTPD